MIGTKADLVSSSDKDDFIVRDENLNAGTPYPSCNQSFYDDMKTSMPKGAKDIPFIDLAGLLRLEEHSEFNNLRRLAREVLDGQDIYGELPSAKKAENARAIDAVVAEYDTEYLDRWDPPLEERQKRNCMQLIVVKEHRYGRKKKLEKQKRRSAGEPSVSLESVLEVNHRAEERNSKHNLEDVDQDHNPQHSPDHEHDTDPIPKRSRTNAETRQSSASLRSTKRIKNDSKSAKEPTTLEIMEGTSNAHDTKAEKLHRLASLVDELGREEEELAGEVRRLQAEKLEWLMRNEALRNESVELEVERNEALQQQKTAVEERDKALSANGHLQREKEEAISARDQAVKVTEAALLERDEAVRDKGRIMNRMRSYFSKGLDILAFT